MLSGISLVHRRFVRFFGTSSSLLVYCPIGMLTPVTSDLLGVMSNPSARCPNSQHEPYADTSTDPLARRPIFWHVSLRPNMILPALINLPLLDRSLSYVTQNVDQIKNSSIDFIIKIRDSTPDRRFNTRWSGRWYHRQLMLLGGGTVDS